MDVFEARDLIEQRSAGDSCYLEFLRVPDLNCGLYVLAAGSDDTQQPHAEDEVYYVIEGRATIAVADEDRPVEARSIVCVAAGVEHHFHHIEEQLRLLVFFASKGHGEA